MTEEPEKVVWVLGSGFSRSLGGPLLKDLFSMHTQERIFFRYGDPPESDVRLIVYKLYHERSKNWTHAEEFLEHLDLATRDEKRRQQVGTWAAEALRPIAPEEILAAAKRIVAAECCEFLSVVEETDERAGPYARWAKRLSPADTVITFNYDAVLEKLAWSKFHVVTAPINPGDHETITDIEMNKKALLLKLHGSVMWNRGSDGRILCGNKSDLERAVTLEDPVIAIPGRAKKESAGGEFKAIWTQAARALREAQRIIFLGYGWPPSDAEARRMLFDALECNDSQELHVHLVLGGNTVVTDRVSRFIEFAGVRAGRETDPLGFRRVATGEGIFERMAIPFEPKPLLEIHVEPLYAEEFIEAYKPGVLA